MNAYKEYILYTIDYKKKYGEHTIVLYRSGIHYEVYHKHNDGVCFDDFVRILNTKATEKDGKKVSMIRYLDLDEKIELLLQNNFTVIVSEQNPRRCIKGIYTPGVYVTTSTSPVLAVAHFEEGSVMGVTTAVVGLSYIDLTTGRSRVCELTSTSCDDLLSQLSEKIIQIKPREFVLTSKAIDSAKKNYKSIIPSAKEISFSVEVVHNILVRDNLTKLPTEFGKAGYREQLLEKIYPKRGVLSIMNFLGLEDSVSGEISFSYLIDYVFKQSEVILKSIPKPLVDDGSDQNLYLTPLASKNLNLAELSTLINKCKTPMGKRYFEERLYNPSTCTIELNASYEIVEKMLPIFTPVRTILEKTYDLEKHIRLMERGKMNPCDFWNIDVTLKAAKKLIVETPFIFSGVTAGDIQDCMDYYSNWLNLNLIHESKLGSLFDSFFNLNVNERIDVLQQKKDELVDYFNTIKKRISPHCKLEKTPRGYSLKMSEDKWKRVRDEITGIIDIGVHGSLNLEELGCKLVSLTSKVYELHSPIIDRLNISFLRYEEQLASEITSYYIQFVASFVEKYGKVLFMLAEFITLVDWYSNNAYCAHHNRYTKPKIQNCYKMAETRSLKDLTENDSQSFANKRPDKEPNVPDGSEDVVGVADNQEDPRNQEDALTMDRQFLRGYVSFKNARHPIVELVETRVPYVPNSLSLTADNLAIFLYGENLSGKSTTIKTVGLLIIMAQCGMFVPCESMEYTPYTRLFVRLPRGDDIVTGKSTFEGEGCDLRAILEKSDERSLVIGDELCSGTESQSACAIVAASVMKLFEKRTNFIFATHYHDLTKLSAIRNLIKCGSIKVYHHSVQRDPKTGIKTFDRKLKEGQGSSFYGLEACKSLGFNDEFIKLANSFRKELVGESTILLSHKSSKYGGGEYIDQCKLCGDKMEEVHHIKEQHTADKDGFIGFEHKNRRSNQAFVCGKCHDMNHNGDLKVEGYVKTSEGIKLVVNSSENHEKVTDSVLVKTGGKEDHITSPYFKKPSYDESTINKVKAQLKLGRTLKSISIDCGVTIYTVKKIAQMS